VISLHPGSRAVYANTMAAVVRKTTGSGPTDLENGTVLLKMHSGMSGSAFSRIARALTITEGEVHVVP
jgi:archaellin